jgi:hypothetical protein
MIEKIRYDFNTGHITDIESVLWTKIDELVGHFNCMNMIIAKHIHDARGDDKELTITITGEEADLLMKQFEMRHVSCDLYDKLRKAREGLQ